MLCVPYKEHRTNDQLLREDNTSRKVINKIRQIQCRLIGHIICGGAMENLVTGKILGKRSREWIVDGASR
jgi:hypothetical protein